jgi:hypothetical protein
MLAQIGKRQTQKMIWRLVIEAGELITGQDRLVLVAG